MVGVVGVGMSWMPSVICTMSAIVGIGPDASVSASAFRASAATRAALAVRAFCAVTRSVASVSRDGSLGFPTAVMNVPLLPKELTRRRFVPTTLPVTVTVAVTVAGRPPRDMLPRFGVDAPHPASGWVWRPVCGPDGGSARPLLRCCHHLASAGWIVNSAVRSGRGVAEGCVASGQPAPLGHSADAVCADATTDQRTGARRERTRSLVVPVAGADRRQLRRVWRRLRRTARGLAMGRW